jgi:hypothetical protein
VPGEAAVHCTLSDLAYIPPTRRADHLLISKDLPKDTGTCSEGTGLSLSLLSSTPWMDRGKRWTRHQDQILLSRRTSDGNNDLKCACIVDVTGTDFNFV